MSSDGDWGDLAEADSLMAEVWDAASRLPDPGENELLDAFVQAKNISIAALVKIGTKIDENTLVFVSAKGLKFRDLTPGAPKERWNYFGSEFPVPRIIQRGAEPSDTVAVVEGETDAARLIEAPYSFDVAILQAGAKGIQAGYGPALSGYSQVLVATDNDEAGEIGFDKIKKLVTHAQRWAPPESNDWSAFDGEWPALPERPVVLPIIVKGADLLELTVPDVASWFENALLPIGGSMIVHAPAKSFKSFAVLDLVSAVSQGEQWCGFDPLNEPGKVCVLQTEIPWPYFHERIERIRNNAAEPALWDENFTVYSPLQRPTFRAGDHKAEDEILTNLVKNDINVFLLDPIRRIMGDGDLNSEKDVRAVLSFLERLQDNGITTIAVHHDNKTAARQHDGDPLSMTGSGAFSGDPDSILSVWNPSGDPDSLQRNVRFTLRNGESVLPRGWQMTSKGLLTYQIEPFYVAGETDDEPQI